MYINREREREREMTTADDTHFEGTHIIEPVGIGGLAPSYSPFSSNS